MITQAFLDILESSRAAGWVLEPLAKQALGSAGLPVPDGRWVHDASAARAAACALGFPLVAKVVSPAVLHKSDVGGVVVGLRDLAAVDDAFARFAALPQFQGMLVERMGRGVEMILGSRFDAQFGPLVVVGIGGTGVEIYQDVAICIAPVTGAQATSALASLKGARLLQGHRGQPPVDLAALSRLVVAFSQLVYELADRVESVDLNPVLCSAEGVLIADARIMLP